MIWSLAAQVARLLPGEPAHRLAVRSLAMGIGPTYPAGQGNPRLRANVAGINFPNPIGLAAGFDKNAEAINGSLKLGFGFTEVGTITPKGQPGNPKPRVFRLPSDGAVINRYGFNNEGMEKAAARLAHYRQGAKGDNIGGVVGVNIGANKDSSDRINDYFLTAERLAQYADYITVNVSSPNTPGLRGLQEPEFLKNVLKAAKDGAKSGLASGQTPRPIFLKIAPDLDHDGLIAAIEVALDEACAGMIIANTTISRPDDLTHLHKNQAGGLSGQPLLALSSQMLFAASQHLSVIGTPSALPIIAVGGVNSAETAYFKLLLGASLVQIYSGLALKGPTLPRDVLDGLEALFKRDGITEMAALKHASLTYDDAYTQAFLS